MLAELAAANAAFAIIKEAISNGRELASAGKQVADFALAKEGLQKKINSKKSSGANPLAEFMALEQIKQKEDELKQIMIYAGRPGLWRDWKKFQADAQALKAAAKKKEAARSAVIRERINMAIATVLFILIVGGILSAAFYMRVKGLI